MIVLGIHDGHDAGAVLLKDGTAIAAVNEERLSRKKLTCGFPEQAIRSVFEISGVSKQDVDSVSVASVMTPPFLLRLSNKGYRRSRSGMSAFSYRLWWYELYQAAGRRFMPIRTIESFLTRHLYTYRLRRLGFRCRLTLTEHHRCHALAAASGGKALVVCLDHVGDGISTTVWIADKNAIRCIFEQGIGSSTGRFFAELTEMAGLVPGKDEGKLCALAAYGGSDGYAAMVNEMLSCRQGGFLVRSRRSEVNDRPALARAAQRHLEREVLKFVRYWMGKTGAGRLALSGGVFANVKLNGRIAEIVPELYVFPHMGDGGLAYGAGCSPEPGKMLRNLFLGPEYSDEEIWSALRSAGLMGKKERDIEEKIAVMLSRGRAVCRFAGRMEYGPRALGNRSVLCQATDPDARKWLNAKLRRPEYMPFSPATLKEYADKCYIGINSARQPAEQMAVAFDCTRWMRQKSPGAVHVDGTARPQIVTWERCPGLHRILSSYLRMTGLPSVINTSFNVHEEPIVCSPRDAVGAFMQSGLDALAIGKYIVTRDGRPAL
ncbi:MAG: carbamoyltransferase C-terminal domain-containing protein [archaeon]